MYICDWSLRGTLASPPHGPSTTRPLVLPWEVLRPASLRPRRGQASLSLLPCEPAHAYTRRRAIIVTIMITIIIIIVITIIIIIITSTIITIIAIITLGSTGPWQVTASVALLRRETERHARTHRRAQTNQTNII